MAQTDVEVLVIGAGQAGVAMSEHLTAQNIPHVVLERKRIAERWRSERWDSLVANGPAWHDRFPNMQYPTGDDEFPGKETIASYFENYAKAFNAPIKTGVEVTSVRKIDGKRGFQIESTDGDFNANYVVVATGPFQKPIIPAVVPETAGIVQLHSNAYHNPAQLPDGNVLIVGAGSSGVQIADEIQASGKQVYLSVGPHDRPPRSYRGRDFVWWLGVLGLWDATTPTAGAEHVTIAVSGAHGGNTVDFRNLAARGIILVGRTESFEDGRMLFAPDLGENISRGDANYLSLLDSADAFVERNGIELPLEPEARVFGPNADCISNPLKELDLEKAGVTSIIWATGYRVDFSWLHVNALDESGRPQHSRGVSTEPGIYFLGLPWLSRRGSAFIWGVWHDAKYLADQITIQRSYLQHSSN